MSNVIHGQSHKAIRLFRKQPAALAVLWIYASRTNYDNVAWPSVRGLAHDTGWGKEACLNARAFLVQHEALEVVEHYVRPAWRDLKLADRTRRLNLDKAEYFRPTGKLVIDDKKYPILYSGGDFSAGIEDEDNYPDSADKDAADVPPGLTSDVAGHERASDVPPGLMSDAADVRRGPMSDAADVRPDGTERITISQLDSKTTELNTQTTTDTRARADTVPLLPASVYGGGGENDSGQKPEKDSSTKKEEKELTDTARLLRAQGLSEAVARSYGWIEMGEVLALVEQVRQKVLRNELRTNKPAYLTGALKKIDERVRDDYARAVGHGLFKGSYETYLAEQVEARLVADQIMARATNGQSSGNAPAAINGHLPDPIEVADVWAANSDADEDIWF